VIPKRISCLTVENWQQDAGHTEKKKHDDFFFFRRCKKTWGKPPQNKKG